MLVAMERLIAADIEPPTEEPIAPIKPVVLPEKPEVPEYRTKPELEPVVEPPAMELPSSDVDIPDDGYNQIALVGPAANEFSGEDISLYSGGHLVKQVMIAPIYPRKLLARGVEGYVDVQFVVTPKGSTDRILVVNSMPEGAFDRAAVKAVAKWKYLPPADSGIKTNSEPQLERIRFEIQN
jgi:protein TonB